MSAPTPQAYAEFQRAYDHFNAELFGNVLPDCLITLQRKRRFKGYFSPRKFVAQSGQVVHEIALNPSFFAVSPVEQVLSTLVHEMEHLRQEEQQTAGRGRYHNRSWAGGMISLGLYPSSSGQPGGSETGNRVSHYIVEGGPFIGSCRRLLSKDFMLSWHERVLAVSAEEARRPVVEGMAELSASPYDAASSRYELVPEAEGDASGRVRYACPSCDLLVWGRGNLKLLCVACNRALLPSRITSGHWDAGHEEDE